MSPFWLFRWAVGPRIKHVRSEIFGQTAMKRSLLRPNWKRLFNKWNGLCFTGQVFSLGEHLGGLAVALQESGVAWGSLSRQPWELAMGEDTASLLAETWEKILEHTETRFWHKVCFSFLDCGVGLVFFLRVELYLHSCNRVHLYEGTA